MTHRPLTPALTLLNLAAADLRQWWRTYTAIFLVAAVPAVALVTLADEASTEASYAYAMLISFFLAAALLSTAARQVRQASRPTVRQAYYQGTAHTLSLILTTLLAFTYIFLAVPVGLARLVAAVSRRLPARWPGWLRLALRIIVWVIGGLLVLALAVVAAVDWNLLSLFIQGTSPGDWPWIYYLTLLVIIPALYITVRCLFAAFASSVDGEAPVASITLSRRLTRPVFWPVVGRLLILLLALILVGLLAGLVMLLVGLTGMNQQLLSVLFQLMSNIVTLPLAALYLMYLYQDLRGIN